ncbi:MAG: hypothetical protein IPH31_21915 [Lewinellaceae bacterium]|nr:hypothetical protein [Lewinellaceae bacterium]
MKHLVLSLLFALPFVAQAQCSIEEYQILLKEAKTAQQKGQYDLAINKLFSARVCRPEKEEDIKKKILEVFEEVNRQREMAIKSGEEAKQQRDSATLERINAFQRGEEARQQRDTALVERNKAEKRVRENYANDLAYKSQTALRKGNRIVAFRLAEFIHQYVDGNNANATRALIEAKYFKDNPKRETIPWASNLEGHTDDVLSVAFFPDGKRLATGSMDGTARIWDVKSGKSTITLEGHVAPVRSIEISPDGKTVATGSWDSMAKIWDVESGKNTHARRPRKFDPLRCLFPNGKILQLGPRTKRSEFGTWKPGRSYVCWKGIQATFRALLFRPMVKC